MKYAILETNQYACAFYRASMVSLLSGEREHLRTSRHPNLLCEHSGIPSTSFGAFALSAKASADCTHALAVSP